MTENSSTDVFVGNVYNYIVRGCYPPSATANEKRAKPNKAKKFSVKEGELYFNNSRRGRGHQKVSSYVYF